MRVALVHDYLLTKGGAERVLETLVEIFPRADIYTIVLDPEKFANLSSKTRIFTSFLQKTPFKKNMNFLRIFAPVAIESLDLSDYDLVISDSSAYAHGVITKTSTCHICYYHTPMRYLWDYYPNLLSQPELKGLKGILAKTSFHFLRIWDQAASKRPDFVIANSKNVAQRIKHYYRREVDAIIYPPVDIHNLKLSQEKKDYFLVVSRLTPPKKVEIAIRAANELKERLLVVGEGRSFSQLKNLAGPTIQLLGFQEDNVIKELLGQAQAFLFTPEEDFGIAPVEAMACGTPVIAYKAGGALETVIEGKTGIFFDKQTPESLKEAILKFKRIKHNFDPQVIRKHSLQFSKEIFIERFKKFVEQKLGLKI